MSATKRPLPKRLEEDLKNAPRYKPHDGGLNTNPSSKKSLSKILDDSVERAMFDEILGPMVKPNGSKRGISSANSPIRSYIRQVSNRENNSPKSLNLANNGLLGVKRTPDKKSGDTSSSPGNSRSSKGNNTNMSMTSKEKENSFTSSILTRLSTVEKDNKEMRRNLAEKIARLEEVEAENARLKNIIAKEDEAYDRNKESRDKQRDDNNRDSREAIPSSSHRSQASPRDSPISFTSASRLELIDEIKDLTLCNEDLTQQLTEMEQFLNDYGLVWVGNEKSAAAQGSSKDKSAPTTNSNKDKGDANANEATAIPKESKGYVLGRGSEEKGYDYGRGVSYRAMLSQERQRIDAKAEQDKNVAVLSPKSKAAARNDASEKVTREREHKEDRDDTESNTNALDFHLFKQRIQELNDLINSEPAQVRREKHNHRQARLMQPSEFFESVPITVYSNGIMLKRGPFRTVDSPGYNSLVRDVLDGYFPSDLRQDHPDGVIFDLFDKHLETYVNTSLSSLHTHAEPTTSTSSSNVGVVTKLGGLGTIEDIIAERAAALSKKGAEGKKYSSMAPEGYMTKEQLLNRLPATKVHSNGDVVNIRSDVGDRLNLADPKEGSGSPIRPMTSPQRLSGRDRALGLSPVPIKAHGNNGEAKDTSDPLKGGIMYVHTAAAGQSRVATIKVKWHTGQVLQMEVFPQELIGDVRQYINRHFTNLKYTQSRRNESKDNDQENSHSTDFELRTAYPPAVLRNDMTVEEAKLVPNGTLIARKC